MAVQRSGLVGITWSLRARSSSLKPRVDSRDRPTLPGMAVWRESDEHHADGEHLELPAEELLGRSRPLPAPEATARDEVSEEEGEALLAAVRS